MDPQGLRILTRALPRDPRVWSWMGTKWKILTTRVIRIWSFSGPAGIISTRNHARLSLMIPVGWWRVGTKWKILITKIIRICLSVDPQGFPACAGKKPRTFWSVVSPTLILESLYPLGTSKTFLALEHVLSSNMSQCKQDPRACNPSSIVLSRCCGVGFFFGRFD